MSKRSRKHQWDTDKKPFLPDHSEAKHSILSGYIQKYLKIVCQPRTIQKYNLTLVDGFSGGGIYQNNKIGSPLVMIDAVSKSIFDINTDRAKHVDIDSHYFFIENDSKNYDALVSVLSERHKHLSNVKTIQDDFNVSLPSIVTYIKKRNTRGGGGAIFFLDQDGYSSVTIESLTYIRKNLPKAEIIVNINVSWLIDFIEDSDRFRNTISNMGLADYLDSNEIIDLKNRVKESRYIIEAKLSAALQRASGFPYFRPFFIEPDDNHRGYWLLHLAPHYRAHNAMSEIIWENGNHMRHYGGDGTRIFDLSYKGGVDDVPDLFGVTFNQQTKKDNIAGLERDLPEIIWNAGSIEISRLIESTCNNTLASQDMYAESLLRVKNRGDIIILGKSGGKKRGDTIKSSDLAVPNKQLRLFLK